MIIQISYFCLPKIHNIGQDWPAHPTFWLSLFPPFPHNTLRKNEPTLEKSMAGRNLAILHLSFVEDLDMFRHTIEQVASCPLVIQELIN